MLHLLLMSSEVKRPNISRLTLRCVLSSELRETCREFRFSRLWSGWTCKPQLVRCS